MNTLSVSSYSVREQLGPVVFDFEDPQGNNVHMELPYPKLLSLSEFPARAVDAFGVDSIETVAFQFDGLEDPEIERWIERFTAMGSQFVRVNPGSPFSRHHGDKPPAHLTDALGEIGAFAKEHGARLLVENHGGPSSDPARRAWPAASAEWASTGAPRARDLTSPNAFRSSAATNSTRRSTTPSNCSAWSSSMRPPACSARYAR